MLQQTLPPRRWVIVNDGSTDDTADIVERATGSIEWIEVVNRFDRGHRSGEGGVEAFNVGVQRVEDIDWDFLVNLDGDLKFAEDYFERCLAEFATDSALGIAGGKVYDVYPDRIVHDPHPDFHVRGATKIYRRACWNDIGGLVEALGWDTLDEVKANQLGWATRTLAEPTIHQLRPTGRAAGTWSNWVKNGAAAYQCGYYPGFVLMRAGRRLVQPPSITAPIGLLWGYLFAWLSRADRVDDPELLRYVRQQQLNRLLGRETMWK
jgi:glycosyltransferase involved in cell wall biosynthesis